MVVRTTALHARVPRALRARRGAPAVAAIALGALVAVHGVLEQLLDARAIGAGAGPPALAGVHQQRHGALQLRRALLALGVREAHARLVHASAGRLRVHMPTLAKRKPERTGPSRSLVDYARGADKNLARMRWEVGSASAVTARHAGIGTEMRVRGRVRRGRVVHASAGCLGHHTALGAGLAGGGLKGEGQEEGCKREGGMPLLGACIALLSLPAVRG